MDKVYIIFIGHQNNGDETPIGFFDNENKAIEYVNENNKNLVGNADSRWLEFQEVERIN